MPTRRTVLSVGAAATAAAVPLVASAFFSKADAGEGLPVVIDNSTGRFPDSAITLYVVGTDPAGRQGYVKESGVFTPASPEANGPEGYADVGVRLRRSGTTSFILPKMSGRIYVAVEGRLRFTVVADGAGRPALRYPAPWVREDPDFDVLHDFVEFTYNDAGMFCNTTMVDMFSIPMAIRVEGRGRTMVAGAPQSGGRDAIFTEMARQPGFERLVIGDRLRILAPSYGIEQGLFAPTYFDSYVDEIWDRYARTNLHVATMQGGFTGRITDGRLRFDGGVREFSRPSTMDILRCNGTLDAPNDALSGPVAAILGAGFNRSVLGRANQPVREGAGFYQHPVTNHYSRILHAHSGDGKAYGFPFDDVADHASYVQHEAPERMHLSLTPFGGGTTRQAPPTGTTLITGAATGRIAAAAFSAQRGVRVEECAEGGENIGYIASGDRVFYRDIDFGSAGTTRFQVRVASGAPAGVSGVVEVRVDDPGSDPIGSINVANTGGWQTWQTMRGVMSRVNGVHDVLLTFASGQPQEFVNVRWFQFGD